MYCEGLLHFVPLISGETDEAKRLHLQQQATNYMERAEEIKHSINEMVLKRQTSTSNSDAPSTSTSQTVRKAIEPTSSYKQLCKVS